MPETDVKIQIRIAQLQDMDRNALYTEWMKVLKHSPLKGARNITLIRGLSYHAQEKVFGRLKPSTLKRLQKVANGHDGNCCNALRGQSTGKPQPGSQLIREWNGKTHSVVVTELGFMWNGVTYTSLSSVAHAITGARWSGPRFFGLKGRIS